MILLGMTGTYVQIIIMLILSLLLFGFFVFLIAKYMILVKNEENRKAERYVAYSGYYAVLSMISMFLIICFGFKNDIIEISDVGYYGLFAALLAFAYVPLIVFVDIKQVRWIKELSLEKQKEYGISAKDRLPLVIVMAFLGTVNMALFGLCIERFIFVLMGLIG